MERRRIAFRNGKTVSLREIKIPVIAEAGAVNYLRYAPEVQLTGKHRDYYSVFILNGSGYGHHRTAKSEVNRPEIIPAQPGREEFFGAALIPQIFRQNSYWIKAVFARGLNSLETYKRNFLKVRVLFKHLVEYEVLALALDIARLLKAHLELENARHAAYERA